MNRPSSKRNSRFSQLAEQFTALESEIKESPEKKALSLLHGMIQDLARNAQQQGTNAPSSETSLEDIASLYEFAPSMEEAAESSPLAVGTQAPDFSLPDANGKLINLSDYRGKPLIIAFYPLDWSPGCSQQLDLYEQEMDEFEKRGVNIIGISVDSLYSHGAWAAVRGISFPLLSDFHPKGEVCRRYQVFRETDGFADRTLYVLDADGIIHYAYVSPYVHYIPDIYDLFKVLDSLNEKHPIAHSR